MKAVKKTVRRCSLIAACILMVLILAGCCMSHDWQEATCTEAKTCSKCGKTEGESLGHQWEEATCTQPRTCSVCGKTRGEALEHDWQEATCTEARTCTVCGETEGTASGHDWMEATCTQAKTCLVCGEVEGEAPGHDMAPANYQQCAVCRVCGETEGEPLAPAFEEYDIPGTFMSLGKTYDYETNCYEDPNVSTTGRVTVTDYQVFDSDATHPAQAGYEWRIVECKILFSDENANSYGYRYGTCTEDYYDVVGHDHSLRSGSSESEAFFTANWNGQDYSQCLVRTYFVNGEWVDETSTVTARFAWLVPKGYDGCVCGFYDRNTEWEDGMHIFDVADGNSLFFRLD